MKPIQSNALKEVNQEVVNQWGIEPHRLTCFHPVTHRNGRVRGFPHGLLKQLKQIPDHRGVQGRKYPLWTLIILLLIGNLCGYEGYRPISGFCQKHK